MKIVLAHNYYQQPGGEDQVFESEGKLLEQHGHEVSRYTAHNDDVAGMNKLALAKATVWNSASYKTLRDLFQRRRPDIVHVHNTLPVISPAIYYAAKTAGAAVVQTLHNYRLLCPAATFFRKGSVCEDCLGKALPWPGVQHACYRHDRAASAAVAAMLTYHRLGHTYQNKVDAYIALTEFSRQKFIEGGLPAAKLHVKANFLESDPGVGSGKAGYALFVGRLSPEKGVDTLLQAWQHLKERLPLKIVGEGPLASQVAAAARQLPGVEWLGKVPRQHVLRLMQAAQFLVFPSLWYEGFPLVIVEAFAVGLLVITSRLGSAGVLIDHQRTGLHFAPGHPHELVNQISWALAHPKEVGQMRTEARLEFERNYTAEQNYHQLLSIYERAREAGRLNKSTPLP